jgi:predicted peptidase
MVGVWQGVADRHGWLVMASKFFRNGIDVNRILISLLEDARTLAMVYPIDTSHIVASGFSGGGMGSYELAELAPELISALVINSGLMHRSTRQVPDQYPKGKRAVYLASPTDFRYREMETDRVWVERLGWKTKWIEFQGGHIPAPDSAYEEAAGWLETQW